MGEPNQQIQPPSATPLLAQAASSRKPAEAALVWREREDETKLLPWVDDELLQLLAAGTLD